MGSGQYSRHNGHVRIVKGAEQTKTQEGLDAYARWTALVLFHGRRHPIHSESIPHPLWLTAGPIMVGGSD